MNELQVFNPHEFSSLKNLEQEIKGTFKGVLYGLDLGDYTKIGHTSKPHSRILQHKIHLQSYGDWEISRVFVTIPHTNHFETERLVHLFFDKFRKKGTELFKISFEKVLQEFPNIGLNYEDKSREMNAASAKAIETLKSCLLRWTEMDESETDKLEMEAAENNKRCDDAEAWITISEMYDDPEFKEACFYYATTALNGGVPVIPYPAKSIEHMNKLFGGLCNEK